VTDYTPSHAHTVHTPGNKRADSAVNNVSVICNLHAWSEAIISHCKWHVYCFSMENNYAVAIRPTAIPLAYMAWH